MDSGLLDTVPVRRYRAVENSAAGDWGNPVLWAPVATVYQYSEIQNRDRTTKTLELRLGTESSQGFGWLVGFYGNQLDETLSDLSLGDYQPLGLPPDPAKDQSDNVINSGYRASNVALFGELDGDLAADLRWSLGLRGERWSANYQGTTTDFLGTNAGYTKLPGARLLFWRRPAEFLERGLYPAGRSTHLGRQCLG
jgi:outer membrane receptor protein involved in Fe transport